MDIPEWCGTACRLPMSLTPAHLIAEIFVLTGNIGGQEQGRRCEGRRGWTQEPERSPTAISDWIRDDQAMDGAVSGYLKAAWPLGGRKSKGETPMEGFGIGSTVTSP